MVSLLQVSLYMSSGVVSAVAIASYVQISVLKGVLDGVEILLCTIVAHSMSSGVSVASNLRLVFVTWLYDNLDVEA